MKKEGHFLRILKHGLYRLFGKKSIKSVDKHFLPKKRTAPQLYFEKTSFLQPMRKRILLIKLDHIGDFILAIPAISKLKARYPYAMFDIIVAQHNVSIAEMLNIFDNIYVFNFFKRKSSDATSVIDNELNTLLAQLGFYDIAIDLRRHCETRFILTRINAFLKVGYQCFSKEIDAQLDIMLPSYKNTQRGVAMPLDKISITKQMIAIVDALPNDINDFIFLPELITKTDSNLISIAIFPKAGNESKEWSSENFNELVLLLEKNSRINKINIYFVNAVEASSFSFKATSKIQIYVALEMKSLIDSLSSNTLCVANNSGGGHLASYLGVTVIGVYSGHSTVAEWAPVFNDSYVISTHETCSPCHLPNNKGCPFNVSCLNISVDFVYNKIIEAL